MDQGLKILLLLALCTLAVTEQNNILAEPEAMSTETESKDEDSSPKYRNITLNVTISIPKHGNNDTRFTMTRQLFKADTIQITTAAVRPGPKTPCNVSSCGTDNVPELAVFIFQETPEKSLICSTNITNEDLFLTINASTSEISVIPKRKLGTLNSASASVQLILRQADGMQFSNNDTLVSFAVNAEQLWISPTTTAIPTTKTTAVSTNKVTSKQITKAPAPHITTIRKITQKPVAPITTKKPIIIPHIPNNGSSLVRGGLWGMVMLVLIQIFLN